MIRRWFAAILLALSCSFAVSAASAATINRYRLDVRPSESSSSAIDVRMDLEYRSYLSENKRDGFKFVGTYQPRNVRAHTRDGAPLTVQVQREASSGQWKIEFALSDGAPATDLEELRHVVVEFTQEIDERNYWSDSHVTLEWPAQFRLPVTAVEYTVTGFEANGPECGGQRTCRPQSPSSLRLSRANGAVRSTVLALFGGALTWIVTLALALRARYRALVDSKGVVPPAPAPAYVPITTNHPDVYRAPAPLPTPEQLPPAVLPASEKQLWSKAVADTVQLSLLPIVLTIACITAVGTPLAPSLMIFVSFVIGALASLVWSEGAPKKWPSIVAALLLIGPVSAGASGLIVATATGFIGGLIGVAVKNAPAGGGSGSSSCSSGSSCGGGGGGGGCGGGGGGGGCGG